MLNYEIVIEAFIRLSSFNFYCLVLNQFIYSSLCNFRKEVIKVNNIECIFGIVLGVCIILFSAAIGFIFPPMWAGMWIGFKCAVFSYGNLD